jgi:hypothetical protein
MQQRSYMKSSISNSNDCQLIVIYQIKFSIFHFIFDEQRMIFQKLYVRLTFTLSDKVRRFIKFDSIVIILFVRYLCRRKHLYRKKNRIGNKLTTVEYTMIMIIAVRST